jgi:hypothetical protein
MSTLGVFLRLTDDANWALINEGNGKTRSYPVAWLDYSKGAIGQRTTLPVQHDRLTK